MVSRLVLVSIFKLASAMRLEAAKFVRVEPDTTGSLGIPFDTSWLGGSGADVSQYAADELAELPSYLPPPTFVEVFELDRHADAETWVSSSSPTVRQCPPR